MTRRNDFAPSAALILRAASLAALLAAVAAAPAAAQNFPITQQQRSTAQKVAQAGVALS